MQAEHLGVGPRERVQEALSPRPDKGHGRNLRVAAPLRRGRPPARLLHARLRPARHVRAQREMRPIRGKARRAGPAPPSTADADGAGGARATLRPRRCAIPPPFPRPLGAARRSAIALPGAEEGRRPRTISNPRHAGPRGVRGRTPSRSEQRRPTQTLMRRRPPGARRVPKGRRGSSEGPRPGAPLKPGRQARRRPRAGAGPPTRAALGCGRRRPPSEPDS